MWHDVGSLLAVDLIIMGYEQPILGKGQACAYLQIKLAALDWAYVQV